MYAKIPVKYLATLCEIYKKLNRTEGKVFPVLN